MMATLIKLSETHYIIVDKSIQPVQGWYYDSFIKAVRHTNDAEYGKAEHCMQITHSTNSVLCGPVELSLSQVKELLGEVDVEQKAQVHWGNVHRAGVLGYIEGYKQALEDNKEKKYTEEDLRKAYKEGVNSQRFNAHQDGSEKTIDETIQSLQPKTEWSIQIDKDNKITLL